MYLCLMRHGKAQPFSLKKPDKLRELTEKGCCQAASMASWAASWWPEGKTALWVSPYVRTCQTASYLEQQLPIGQFHTHEALASGDLVAVYDQILSQENRTSSASSAIPPSSTAGFRPGRGQPSTSRPAAWPFWTLTSMAGESARPLCFSTFIRKP